MLAYGFAILAVISGALDAIIFKHAVNRGACEWGTLILYHIIAVLLLIPFVTIPSLSELSLFELICLASACTLWVIGDLYGIAAYRFMEASACKVYGTIKIVIITTAGIFFFGESLPPLALVGVGLIIVSIFYQYNVQSKHSLRGSLYMLISAVFIAGALIVDKYLTTIIDEQIIVFYGFLIPMCMYILFGIRHVPKIVPILKQTNYLFLLAPITGCFSHYCLIRALSIGDLSVTYTIQETGIIFVFLFETILLKTQKNFEVRAKSCLTCAIGAILVCLVT